MGHCEAVPLMAFPIIAVVKWARTVVEERSKILVLGGRLITQTMRQSVKQVVTKSKNRVRAVTMIAEACPLFQMRRVSKQTRDG